jgi:hypothetical protein
MKIAFYTTNLKLINARGLFIKDYLSAFYVRTHNVFVEVHKIEDEID